MTDKITKGQLRRVERGGPGSGHHGHAGRPGERGGSAPGSGSGRHTTGEGFYETIGGNSPLSPEKRRQIASNIFNPKSGRGLHQMRQEDVSNTVNVLSQFPLSELRAMQDKLKTTDMNAHYQMLNRVLAAAIDKREFPEKGGPGGGRSGHSERPGKRGGARG